jgi:hypothetical protein
MTATATCLEVIDSVAPRGTLRIRPAEVAEPLGPELHAAALQLLQLAGQLGALGGEGDQTVVLGHRHPTLG